MTGTANHTDDVEALRQELTARDVIIVERDALITVLRAAIASFEAQIEALRATLVNYANDIEVYKRKLFGTKSERSGTNELQLALGGLLDQQAALQKELDALVAKPTDDVAVAPAADPVPPPGPRAKPKGRRDLSLSNLPVVTVTLPGGGLEQTGRLVGYDQSRQLMYVAGGFKVLLTEIPRYEIPGPSGPTVLAVELPVKLFPRALLHTSAVAFLAVEKFGLGVPHYRLEQHLQLQGVELDRGTMCRNVEDLGNTLGATVVEAMFKDALENSCVLSTDATGAAIQPGPRNGGPKRACKKGHFFTIVSDCDHVLFAYAEKHTQDTVAKLFHGYGGYLQSDASSVYDILDRGPPNDDGQSVTLVGCWAHARRYFFDAAICKYETGAEGLTRIRAIYVADNKLKKLPPAERKLLRKQFVMPLIESFFLWANRAARLTTGRNLATKALGYAVRQEQELRRILLDGRLPLDNTRSERALRKIVVGRKNWMFYGSDTHAESAAALFTIIASCRLHKIDPQAYLSEVARLLAYWPKTRNLELAPKYWRATRAKLDPGEIASPVGVITVPD